MKSLIKFISISPSTVLVLTIISLIAGILKSLSIILIVPLINLFEFSQKQNFIIEYFIIFLNFFELDYNLINTFFLIIITSFAAVSIIYVSMFFFQRTVINILLEQRKNYLNNFTSIKWENFNKLKSGEIINASVDQASKAFVSGFIDTINLISYFTQASIMILFAFIVSPIFSLIAIIAGIFSYLFFSIVNKSIIKYSNEVKEYNKIYTVKLSETFHIIKSLITLNKLPYWKASIGKIQQNWSKAFLKLYMYSQFPVQYREPFTIILIGVLIYIVTSFELTDLPTLATLLILFQRISSYIGTSQNLYQTVLKMEVFYDDFHQSKNFIVKNTYTDEISGNSKKINTFKFDNHIRFQNVSIKYDSTPIIKNISFTINKGDIFILKGESGKGKTSIIDIIVGLIRPSEGKVDIDDKDLNDLDKYVWRDKIAYLSQKPELFNASVKENIEFFDENFDKEKLSKSLELSGVVRFLDKLENGIETNAGEFGNKLSGGQKQRVAISRLINLTKDIFILDEPSSSLDERSASIIIDLIKYLKKAEKTIIVITHSNTFDTISDNILEI